MNVERFAKEYLADLQGALAGLDRGKIARATEWLREARDADQTIYACGNGGSASIVSHLMTDLVKGASFGHKQRFKAVGLSDLCGTVSAYANDENYECVFVEPLRNFARPGDVLIALSGSGDSPNVLRAVEYANEAGCRTIGLTTGRGGRLREISQLAVEVDSAHMGRLEDAFLVIVHLLCYAFMDDPND